MAGKTGASRPERRKQYPQEIRDKIAELVPEIGYGKAAKEISEANAEGVVLTAGEVQRYCGYEGISSPRKTTKRIVWDEAKKAEFCRVVREKGLREAERAFGMSVSTAMKYAAQFGAASPKTTSVPIERTEALRAELAHMAATMSHAGIAEAKGWCEDQARLICDEYGIETTRTRILRGHGTNLRQGYFDSWSPDMAYDLGYLFADGNVVARRTGPLAGIPAGIHLKCKRDDREILEGIRRRLRSSHSLVDREVLSFGELRWVTRCAITGGRLARTLVERYGMVPNKCRHDVAFPTVPGEHLSHFLRGNLDGDGTIFRKRYERKDVVCVAFHATPIFAAGIRERLVAALRLNPGRLAPVPTAKNGLHVVRWGGLYDCEKLCRYLWPPGDGYPFLARKRRTADEILALAALADSKFHEWRRRPLPVDPQGV